MRDVLRAVEAVAAAGAVPVVMSYWNPIERYGVDRFAADLAAAGGAGGDHARPHPRRGGGRGWPRPRRTTSTGCSSSRRRPPTRGWPRPAAACRGFVYAASTMGVTGTRATVGDAAEKLVARTRAVTDLPVCVGLGVSNGDQAAEVAGFADGVIVGSAYVRELLEGRGRRRRPPAVAGPRRGRPPSGGRAVMVLAAIPAPPRRSGSWAPFPCGPTRCASSPASSPPS
jgi:tryptophan synthase alpha chain